MKASWLGTLQNIDFQTTILSRFDMIFIVKDEHNETRDKVQMLIDYFELSNSGRRRWSQNTSWTSTWTDRIKTRMKMVNPSVKLISTRWNDTLPTVKSKPWGLMLISLNIWHGMLYSKCAPRLSSDAQEMLSSHFVSLRKQVQQVERDNDERSSIPITIRYAISSTSSTNRLIEPNLGNWRPLSVYRNH